MRSKFSTRRHESWQVYYSWLRVCTCNAELSCSIAFSTGYASRHSSSYKSLEPVFRHPRSQGSLPPALRSEREGTRLLFRVHLGSSVQQGLSAQNTILVNFFPPYLPLETRFGLCFVLCHQINWGHSSQCG